MVRSSASVFCDVVSDFINIIDSKLMPGVSWNAQTQYKLGFSLHCRLYSVEAGGINQAWLVRRSASVDKPQLLATFYQLTSAPSPTPTSFWHVYTSACRTIYNINGK